jgi:Protein of unknown function (DUF2891)
MPAMPETADAERWADCALAAVRRAYPHKLDHLILHADDRPRPAEIHPVFDGCYDWHSSVHMHWSLLRLARSAPALRCVDQIAGHFTARFTPTNVARERSYAAEPGRGGFERPYGWAWLLKLQLELDAPITALPQAAAWGAALRPFAADIAVRLAAFLRQSHYPVRAGLHSNSAFAMLLARRYALTTHDHTLRHAIDEAARRWFTHDRGYPAAYEPGGTDFLSPGLCEALLMHEVLGAAFPPWWQGFAPRDGALAHWLQPARVSDRSDAQLVHLDGLNLSRAWCLAALAPALDADQAAAFRAAAQSHREAAWPHVTGGDFVATHWLVSFALLSLEPLDDNPP